MDDVIDRLQDDIWVRRDELLEKLNVTYIDQGLMTEDEYDASYRIIVEDSDREWSALVRGMN